MCSKLKKILIQLCVQKDVELLLYLHNDKYNLICEVNTQYYYIMYLCVGNRNML